jgi:hypothetical protein
LFGVTLHQTKVEASACHARDFVMRVAAIGTLRRSNACALHSLFLSGRLG